MRCRECGTHLDSYRDSSCPDGMGMGMMRMSETRLSLLVRVRNLADGESWREFHAIYRPLIFGYLRTLGLGEHDAQDLTQEVFCRLLALLPTFELDRIC